MNETKVISRIPATACRSFAMDSRTTEATLDKLGIHFPKQHVQEMMKAYAEAGANVGHAMDVAPEMVTTPTNATAVQFLQHWLPEPVEIVTAKRDIDDIAGRTMAGTFFDAQIVQLVLEKLGQAQPYGDKNNIPLSSWNATPEVRDIVRFEEGLEVGILEEGQTAKMRINSAEWKRRAAAQALEIEANNVGFFGYNNGSNRTYGLLNDPNLPAYVTVANVGTEAAPVTSWSAKTMEQIQADLLAAITRLQVQTGNNYNPVRDEATLAVSLSAYQYLNKLNQIGNKTALQWLKETYPALRVVPSIYLDGAQGGSNVFYLFAERIGSQKVLEQFIQDNLRLLGVERLAKGYKEDYANATAGVMVKQPIGVVRYAGI